MASQPDDVSVDGSTSSITDSQWDVVDEGSAASEDETGGIPRQPTPFSEPPERLTLDTLSSQGNDTGSESQGVRSGRHMIEFNRSRKDSASDPPDTARRTVPLQNLYKNTVDFDFCQEDQEHHIRFAESGSSAQDPSIQDVSFHLTDFEGDERKELAAEHHLRDGVHLRGTLRQSMSREVLRLAGPFKILYHGPGGAKAAIVEKVGTALAAHLTSSTSSGMDSSRVTVVPVSALTDNNAPDIVLIDSMGLDMNIEECTFAGNPRGGAFGGTMSLTINNQKSIESSWNQSSRGYEVSEGYQLPHLAVFHISEDESSTIQQTRFRAQQFLSRHRVAMIAISSTSGWNKSSPSTSVDPRSPHLCLECVDLGAKGTSVLKRLPVDLNTFLSIDAGQLNRNLACLTGSALAGNQNAEQVATARQPGLRGKWRGGSAPGYDKAAISVRKIPILLLSVAWILFIFVMLHVYRGGLMDHRLDSAATRAPLKNISNPPPGSNARAPISHPQSTTHAEDIQRLVSLSQPSSSELVALLMDSSSTPNLSEKFKAQVVGDNHVVLRAPAWYSSMKKPPALHFKVQRDKKEIKYEFSALFDSFFTLRFPPEDAHGMLDIAVWTVRRPRVNESFRVDFGSPWLKIRGWWQSACGMAQSVKGEFSAAQESVGKAYKLANKHLERAEQTFKEVEKASVGSLRMTSKAAQLIVENSKRLSQGLSKGLSGKLLKQQRKIHNDVSGLSKLMSEALIEQVAQMRRVAAGLDVLALKQRVQAYREKNFRQAQIKMLHTWWRLRGSEPSSLRSASPRFSPGAGKKGCGRRSKCWNSPRR